MIVSARSAVSTWLDPGEGPGGVVDMFLWIYG